MLTTQKKSGWKHRTTTNIYWSLISRLKIARRCWKSFFSLLGAWNSVLVIDKRRGIDYFRMELSISHREIKVKLSSLDSFSTYYNRTQKFMAKYFFMDVWTNLSTYIWTMMHFKPVKFLHYLNRKILIVPTRMITQVNSFALCALRNAHLTREDPYNLRYAKIKVVPLIFLTFYSKI